MQFVLYLFSLSSTFYLVSGACHSNTWSHASHVNCNDDRRSSPAGTKMHCFCKANCFPVILRCNGNGDWVSALTTSNPCTYKYESESLIDPLNLPGLMMSYNGHKVKFACEDGFELEGTHVALCEKGELHMDDLPTCVQSKRIPDDFEGSGSGSGDSPRRDDDGSDDDDVHGRLVYDDDVYERLSCSQNVEWKVIGI
ncbi:hypothetical protein B566_EDAN013308 [Ephemera danica]|nr:hypothetical protein B566_EDAN013308 [Ephemera danica]